jgi:hypothetical protein
MTRQRRRFLTNRSLLKVLRAAQTEIFAYLDERRALDVYVWERLGEKLGQEQGLVHFGRFADEIRVSAALTERFGEPAAHEFLRRSQAVLALESEAVDKLIETVGKIASRTPQLRRQLIAHGVLDNLVNVKRGQDQQHQPRIAARFLRRLPSLGL